MAISIAGITNLGDINEEEIQIDSKLLSVPRPLGSTDNNTVSNLFGKARRITISGSHHGQGYSVGTVDQNIAAFIADIEDWVNANTQSAKTYTDSVGNTYSVLCNVFRWTRSAPGTQILYVISMIEGSGLAIFNP